MFEFGKEWDDPEDWIQDPEFSHEANTVVRAGLNTLCQKIGRILTGSETLTVGGFETSPVMTLQNFTPGVTVNGAIYINHNYIEGMAEGTLEKQLRLTIGVFLHELGHVDFTPRLNDPVFVAKRKEFVAKAAASGEPSYWSAIQRSDYCFNMLEDQREELLEGTRYPKARDYYRLVMIAMIRKALRAKPGIGPQWLALYYGRRHLFPDKFVKKMEQSTLEKYGADRTNRIKAIITKYQSLPSRGDDNLATMQDLAWELQTILVEDTPIQDQCAQSTKKGPRMRQKDEEQIREQAQDGMEKLDKQREEDSEEEPEDGPPEDDGATAEAEDAAGRDGDAEDTERNGSGATGDDLEDAIGSLDELEEKIVDRLDDDIQDKMDSLQDNIASGYDDMTKTGKADGLWSASSEELDEARHIANYFKDIAIDLKQQYFRNLKRGRLDTRRLSAALASNSVRLFKRRQPDISNMASMAVHVAFDGSGSMNGFYRGEYYDYSVTPPKLTLRYSNGWLARSAAYIISTAAALGGHYSRVTVFGTETRSIKGWNDKEFMGNRVSGIGGSTNPTKGFQRAIRDFQAICEAKGIQNKVYIIMTDGGFDKMAVDIKLLKILKRTGCHIYIMGIGFTPDPHLNEFNVVVVPSAAELEGAMKDLLKELSLKITKEVRRNMM